MRNEGMWLTVLEGDRAPSSSLNHLAILSEVFLPHWYNDFMVYTSIWKIGVNMYPKLDHRICFAKISILAFCVGKMQQIAKIFKFLRGQYVPKLN